MEAPFAERRAGGRVSQKAIPFACLQPWSVLGSGLQPAARVFAELSRPSIAA